MTTTSGLPINHPDTELGAWPPLAECGLVPRTPDGRPFAMLAEGTHGLHRHLRTQCCGECGDLATEHRAGRHGMGRAFCTATVAGQPCRCQRYVQPRCWCRWPGCTVTTTGNNSAEAWQEWELHRAKDHPPCHPDNETRWLAAHPEWRPRRGTRKAA